MYYLVMACILTILVGEALSFHLIDLQVKHC